MAGIDENRLTIGKHKVKVRYFPGARTDDMYDYMKPLLRKWSGYVILHTGTNDALDNTSSEILVKIFKQKMYIQKELPKCEIKLTISTPFKRCDHGKASLIISHWSKKFKDLSISIADNSNIGTFYLNSGGLHLNDKGLGRLAINLNLEIRKLWYELEPMNDDHDKKMLNENTNNWSKESNYEFSTSDEVAKEKEDAKSSLCNLKLRNVNRLIFSQININSIRNRFYLLFSSVY